MLFQHTFKNINFPLNEVYMSGISTDKALAYLIRPICTNSPLKEVEKTISEPQREHTSAGQVLHD